jgi:hypothetical protein
MPMMRDPQTMLAQVSQGPVPADWSVFTKRRSRVGGFLRGTSGDPDPLLVIMPEGVVEFVDGRKGTQVLDFHELSEVTLRVQGSSFSDSIIVRLDVWLDLRFHDGRKQKWRSATFADDHRTIQSFLEAFGAHKALRSRPLP